MEPPAKRPRRDPSWPSDTDDELAFDPFDMPVQEGIASEDEFERAMEETDNRFQSAMAHIFEKYSRDFEGVGDEIDMYTGEVVVDNGHLSKMRHERDIGLPDWMDEEEGEEQEEGGFRLSDLIDEASFSEEPQETLINGQISHVEALPQVLGSTEDSLSTLSIDAAETDQTKLGQITHRRAHANRARLQGRRSSTPAAEEGSIWRPGNTPPRKSETSSKKSLHPDPIPPLSHKTQEREAERPVSIELAVNGYSAEAIGPYPTKDGGQSSSTGGVVSEQPNGIDPTIHRKPGRPRKTTTKAIDNGDANDKTRAPRCQAKELSETGLYKDTEGRRRSARASIPVDYLGKISWEQAQAELEAETKSAASSLCLPSENDRQQVPSANTGSIAVSRPPTVIANSQETHIPSSGEYSAHSDRPGQASTSRSTQVQSSQTGQGAGTSRLKTAQSQQQSWESLYDLSDDEMPMQLPATKPLQRNTVSSTEESTLETELTTNEDQSWPTDGGTVLCELESEDLEQHAARQVISQDMDDNAASEPDLEQDTGINEVVGPTQDRVQADTVIEPHAGHASTEGSDAVEDDDTPDLQLDEAEQSISEKRDASPDLSTPHHVRTIIVEIPESCNGGSSVPPSSSPTKLHSSPIQRRAPHHDAEPTLPPHQGSPRRSGTATPDAARSSPSTSRAIRLQGHGQTPTSSRAARPPVRTYSSRSIWDRRPSPPRTSKQTSPKKSSPLKHAITNSSVPQTPSFRTKRKIATPSSRNSLLSFTRDKDDVDELSEVIGQSDERPLRRRDTISGRIAHGMSTPSSTGRRVRLPYRARVSLGSKQSEMGEVVQSPGGTKRVCGVDGFRCDRDFCFSCL